MASTTSPRGYWSCVYHALTCLRREFSLDDRHSSHLTVRVRWRRRTRGSVILPIRCVASPSPRGILIYWFAKLLSKVLKSAVQSANTVVFIPSSFDFIRVHNYFRKMSGISFAVLSEWESLLARDVLRRYNLTQLGQVFFEPRYIPCSSSIFLWKKGILVDQRTISFLPSVSFLSILVHTWLRALSSYKIRGIRNVLFYGPPTHPQFFSEFLTYPFLDDGVDPSDVTCRVACCRYDWFKLERILGSRGAKQVLDE